MKCLVAIPKSVLLVATILTLILVPVLWKPVFASPGIAKVGTDTSGTGNASPLSFSHTLVAGTNRLVVVSVGIENNGNYDVASVTYGEQSMTKAVDKATGTTGYIYLCEIWYILEANLPSNGAKTVTITGSGTASFDMEINGFCAEYTGVNQGAPEATNGVSQTTGATITNTISPSNNAWVISAVGSGNTGSFTHGSPQVEVRDFADASSAFAVAELRGASGQTSLSSTFSTTVNRLARVCASFTEVVAGYNLNLHVMDWDLADAIANAYVTMNNGTDYLKVSDSNGWANYTGVSGTVTVNVQYYGFWVNGTFSVTMDSDKTIDVQCKLYDVTVLVQEGVQNAYLTSANVTVYNSTSVQGNKITSGVTGNNGQVQLLNLPNNTLTFTQYGAASYSLVIGNTTQLVSSENQTITLTANQNNVSTNNNYSIIAFAGMTIPLKGGFVTRLLKKKRNKDMECEKKRSHKTSGKSHG